MHSDLSRIEGLVGQKKELGIELFLADHQLSEVYRSCNRERIVVVDPHSVEIRIAIDPQQVLQSGHISKETHTLEISGLVESISRKYQFIPQKYIRDAPQHVHACIFPQPTLAVKYLVAHDISH